MSRLRALTARRRRAVLGLLAAVGLVVSLAACTPSAYQAEKAGVARIHQMLSGQGTTSAHVTCSEFVKQGDAYVGGCYARGWGYLVRSEYNANDTAVVLAGSERWGSLQCATLKLPDGSWGVWNESCF